MKEKRLTKMSAKDDKGLYKIIKANADDSYFLEVLYYYICRALIQVNYNLRNIDGFSINGRFLGYKQEILFSKIFNTPLKSLGFALSVRAIILNKDNIKCCYDNGLLFYDLDSNVITWNSHRVIMECIHDEEFRQLYEMVVTYKMNHNLEDKQKEIFESHTVRPEYKNLELYCKSLASDSTYEGKTIIKDNFDKSF